MKRQTKLARMTIDLSKEEHQKLKALAAILGKSLRELVLEAIEIYINTDAVRESLSSITKTIDSIKRNSPQ